jgi:hypothetical protein
VDLVTWVSGDDPARLAVAVADWIDEPATVQIPGVQGGW